MDFAKSLWVAFACVRSSPAATSGAAARLRRGSRFSRMQRLLWLFVLAGCPAPARYVVADVTAARAPVQGALVAAECANERTARRTDEDGRARVRVMRDSHSCSLVVAKPGLPTVETGPVNTCPTANACAPARVDLTPRYDANPYARPAIEVAE